MMNKKVFVWILVLAGCGTKHSQQEQILFKHVTLLDGKREASQQGMDLLVQGDTILAIGQGLTAPGAQVLDLRGKTIIPALISAHTHVGTLQGTTTSRDHYTRANVMAQLDKYMRYGVGTIQTMGTDRPLIFDGLRDSSMLGLLPGARLHTAGYGFAGVDGAPPADAGMDLLYRPEKPADVAVQVEALSRLKVDLVKMWVDDFGGTVKKMPQEVYTEIIRQAHDHHLRVASHLYYLDDAKKLVAAGLDVIAHSVRDREVDEELLVAMKNKGVVYIPTLSLDLFSFIYDGVSPPWMDDPFFKAALEPGVWEMVKSPEYQDKVRNSPVFDRNKNGSAVACRNVKKVYDAGVLVALGTDSGATPVRAQGFSEHLELELMVQAGLTPLQALRVGTFNAALALGIDKYYGSLEPGKVADLIVLSANPEEDVRHTRRIEAVYKAGRLVERNP